MTDKEFTDKSITLSFEFDRYLMSHPELAEQVLPRTSIFFEVADDAEFTTRELTLAEELRKSGEPVVIVRVEKLLSPFESRLINPELRLVSAA